MRSEVCDVLRFDSDAFNAFRQALPGRVVHFFGEAKPVALGIVAGIATLLLVHWLATR